jgi:hypothetical protein
MFAFPTIDDESKGWIMVAMFCLIVIYGLILSIGEAP